MDHDTWRISGQASLSDVAEALEMELPLDEDYDTLGGLIFSQFTLIPEDGSHPVVDCCGLHIVVEQIEEHRIGTALVSKLPKENEPGESETDQKSAEAEEKAHA